MSVFTIATHREYIKAKTNLLYNYETPSWRKAIQRNYWLKNYTFSNVNLDYNLTNLDNRSVVRPRMILFRIYFFSALYLLNLPISFALAIAALIIWQKS